MDDMRGPKWDFAPDDVAAGAVLDVGQGMGIVLLLVSAKGSARESEEESTRDSALGSQRWIAHGRWCFLSRVEGVMSAAQCSFYPRPAHRSTSTTNPSCPFVCRPVQLFPILQAINLRTRGAMGACKVQPYEGCWIGDARCRVRRGG